jgi:quercetin dioxygenase-like cupin family protein
MLYASLQSLDPDTGMMIRLVRYPAGFMNKWHFHPRAHGMSVLEGTLVTLAFFRRNEVEGVFKKVVKPF